MKIKPYLLMGLLGLCLCLLTGCTDARIDCGIDDEHTAFLVIHLSIDTPALEEQGAYEVSQNLMRLADHYRKELGFTVTENSMSTSNKTVLLLRKEEKAESNTAAFAALKKMLTDASLSPFTQVDMALQDGVFEEGYAVTLTVDAAQLIETANLASFPQSLRSYFTKAIDASTAVLTVKLPATQVLESSHPASAAGGIGTATAPISLQEATTLHFVTGASYEGGAVLDTNVTKTADQLARQGELIRRLLWGTIGLGICFALAFLFLLFKRRKQPVHSDLE